MEFWLVWGRSKWGRNKEVGMLRGCSLCSVCHLCRKHSQFLQKLPSSFNLILSFARNWNVKNKIMDCPALNAVSCETLAPWVPVNLLDSDAHCSNSLSLHFSEFSPMFSSQGPLGVGLGILVVSLLLLILPIILTTLRKWHSAGVKS